MNTKKCDVEVFSRVVGFFRPVQSWNKGKAQEFVDRKTYKVDDDYTIEEDTSCRAGEAVAG